MDHKSWTLHYGPKVLRCPIILGRPKVLGWLKRLDGPSLGSLKKLQISCSVNECDPKFRVGIWNRDGFENNQSRENQSSLSYMYLNKNLLVIVPGRPFPRIPGVEVQFRFTFGHFLSEYRKYCVNTVNTAQWVHVRSIRIIFVVRMWISLFFKH